MSSKTVEAPSDYKLTPSSGMPPIPDFKRCLDPGYSYTKTVTTSDNLRSSLFAAFKPVTFDTSRMVVRGAHTLQTAAILPACTLGFALLGPRCLRSRLTHRRDTRALSHTQMSSETVEAPSDYKLTPSSGMPPIPDFKRCLDPGYSYTKTVTTSDNLRSSLFAAFKPVTYES
jgi:hypothetical protein